MFFEPEFWVAVAFVILMVVFGYLGVFKTAMSARAISKRTDRETPFEPMPAQASAGSH